MPKVKITEIDNTGSLQLNPITNVVYIPGRATAKTEPLFCASASDLAEYASTKGLENDLSYKLAKRCLQLGMQVLYQGFKGNSVTITYVEGTYSANIIEDEQTHVLSFTASEEEFTIDSNGTKIATVKQYGPSGEKAKLEFDVVNGVATVQSSYIFDNKEQIIKLDFVNNKVEYNWLGVKSGGITMTDDDWDVISDKALYDLRFITTGGYAIPTQAMITCATKRGDCVALVDANKSDTDVASIRTYLNNFASKYAAAFTPWFKANIGEDTTYEIPASFGYLFAYARSIQNNPTWYAVAGTFRGNIPELVSPLKEYSTAEIEMLQGRAATKEVELDEEGDNVGIAINPIAYVRGYGYLIWGNRTLVANAGYTKATSFLNVRNLCSDIKKTLYAAARKYTFEQNSGTLWLNFKYQITPLLDRMVSGNGIASYVFEQLPTTAKARLKARLTITPIEGVEDFELELYLEDSLEVVE